MLDLGRGGEEFTDQTAPCLEVVAAAEMHGVVFQGAPADHQAVGIAIFDRALQAHRFAAARALEQGHGFGDGRFEGVMRG